MAKKQREKSKKRLFTVIAAVVVIALAAAALLYIPAYRREHEIKSAYPDVTYDSRKFAETDWNRDVSADEDYMGLDRALYMKNGGEEIGKIYLKYKSYLKRKTMSKLHKTFESFLTA